MTCEFGGDDGMKVGKVTPSQAWMKPVNTNINNVQFKNEPKNESVFNGYLNTSAPGNNAAGI